MESLNLLLQEFNFKERTACEDDYGDVLIDYQGGSVEGKRESDNFLMSTDASASLAANSFAASNEDNDNDDANHLNFYNEDMSD